MNLSRQIAGWILASTLCSSSFAASLAGPPQIEDLGSNLGMEASSVAMSKDGNVIVGTMDRNTNRTDAFRWTREGGHEILGTLNGTSSRMVDISDDGAYATGTGSWYRAVRWAPDGTAVDLGTLPGGAFNTYAAGISGDGQTVVGRARMQAAATAHAFAWTPAGGMVDIHPSFGGTYSDAQFASTDGSVVVGVVSTSSVAAIVMFVWTAASGAVEVTMPGFDRMTLTDASDDCSVVVGVASINDTYQAFRWTAASGALPFGPGPSPPLSPIVKVSADGSTVFGGNADGPFIWTEAAGYRLETPDPLLRFIESNEDGSILFGYRFTTTPDLLPPFRWTESLGYEDLATYGTLGHSLVAASSDGSIVAGSGRIAMNMLRPARWRMDGRIGTSFCGPAAANSVSATGASISLSGFNVAALGSLQLNAEDLPRFTFGFFVTSLAQDFVPLAGGSQGNLCLGGAIGRFVGPGEIQQSGPMGRISLTIDPQSMPSPNGPVLPSYGDTWHFQAWFRDANPSATSNFTDGASVTIY